MNRPKLYRKRPVVVNAMEYTTENLPECLTWMGMPREEAEAHRGSSFPLYIHTLEGDMTASVGDFIIQGVQGEFYPCKPDIFLMTYEEVVVHECEERIVALPEAQTLEEEFINRKDEDDNG
jgi:hypothetical protein